MRRTMYALILFWLTAAIADAADHVPAAAASPVRIGLSLGLTGKYAEMADMQFKGFKLWEKKVNQAGGILGRPVRLIIYDDKSTPAAAIATYEKLILRDKVDLLFAPYSSELTEAVLPLTEKHGYPLLASGASADRLWLKGYRHLFGVYVPASKYTVGFLEMLAHHNLTRLAIVYSDDPFSKDIAYGAREWAVRFGLKVLLWERMDKGDAGAEAVTRKARKAGAEVLLVCGHFTEAVSVRKALQQINWRPRAFYASVGPALQSFHDKLGKGADLVFTSSQWEQNSKLPRSVKFHRAFLAEFGNKPSYQAASAYAAGEILATAVRKGGSLERKRITEILTTMKTISIMGKYGVDREGRQIQHFPLTIQWLKGKKEIVWPEELKTAQPVLQ